MVLTSPIARVERELRPAPRIEPIFSYPGSIGIPDAVHEETVRELLAQAAPDSTVHFTTFTLTRDAPADALIAATERGINVNVLIDGHLSETSTVQRLLAELKEHVSINADESPGTNHNKFLLCSELTNGETDVVWQSTSNFTTTQLFRHNTSVVFRGDEALYDVYRTYWDDLFDGKTDPHYNRVERTDSATVFFSPRSDFDTHLEALENIVPSQDATIRFMYSIWTIERGAVVDRIGKLIDQGCTVEVILEAEASTAVSSLRDAGATVLEYPTDTLTKRLSPLPTPNVHSKNMLVDADFDLDGETVRRRLVYTGSQNLSGVGLTDNDEILLRIDDDDVYRQFLRDWERVRDRGRQ
jgi:phosphatidylserine/phosphatidylglycerophosphate/cardiolipin synthase-like enzyme